MLRAFVFGLTLGIAVGPIALLILNYALTRGFLAAAQASLGSAAADLIYALAAFGAGHVAAPFLELHRRPFAVAAGAALVAIGAHVCAGGVRALRGPGVAHSAPASTRHPAVTTFFLTLVNPLTIIGFAAFGAQLDLGASWIAVAGCALAAVAGALVVSLSIAAAGGAVAPFVRGSTSVGWLNVASGAAIAAFGVAGIVG